MPLAPPPEGESHASLEQLIRSVNHHAGPEGYAVVTARTKNSKLGVKRKAWLRCDRGGKSSGPKGQIRIHAASRRINCPFSLIAKRQDDRWSFRVVNGAHSHDPTPPETHPALRRMALAEKKNNGVSSPSRNARIIQSAEDGSGSGMLDAEKATISGNYPGAEEMSPDSCRPKPAQMRSIEDDLLGRLEEALDPRIERGLLPKHGGGGGGGGGGGRRRGESLGNDDQGRDQDGVETDTDANKKGIDIDNKDLETNLDMDHRRGIAGGKALPEPRRKVIRRRENRHSTTTQQKSTSTATATATAGDPIVSTRSFGIINSS